MCEDFEDDFNQGDFMNDNSFDNEYDADSDMDEPITGDSEPNDKSGEAESKDDDFTAKDALIIGGAMGFGYEEGLRERKRRKRKKLRDDSG